MFAYSFTVKQLEPFYSSNDPKGLTTGIHYFDSVTARLIMLVNNLAHFCLDRIVKRLIPANNFITVSG